MMGPVRSGLVSTETSVLLILLRVADLTRVCIQRGEREYGVFSPRNRTFDQIMRRASSRHFAPGR
jgi:hypothetical protein